MEISAIYENGVFRPLEPVLLPENMPVVVHAEASTENPAPKAPPTELYRLLDQRVNTGIPDLAARHNEHQP